jgi:hypothetical protein
LAINGYHPDAARPTQHLLDSGSSPELLQLLELLNS